jgi:hypothetical protein
MIVELLALHGMNQSNEPLKLDAVVKICGISILG